MYQSIFEQLNQINDNLSLDEALKPFANNIDKDILSSLQNTYNEPAFDNSIKCSKSAVQNALYYLSAGEKVEFFLGNINAPMTQITHCWITHNNQIAQTRVPKPNVKLIIKHHIELDSDVEKAKQQIIDLINSINS